VCKFYESLQTIDLQGDIESSKRILNDRFVNLGYGYWLKSMTYGFEKFSLNIEVLLNDTGLVYSQKMTMVLPYLTRFSQEYEQFLKQKGFKPVNESAWGKYIDYEESVLLIDGKQCQKKDSLIRWQISPFSGVTYGNYGGIGNKMLESRSNFNRLSIEAINDDLEILMKSINPATRLMAVEYFLNNFERFRDDDLLLKAHEAVREPLFIGTIEGCIESYDSSIVLLRKYSNFPERVNLIQSF
jgi:hypothetical protein